jgi:hypothetical protein
MYSSLWNKVLTLCCFSYTWVFSFAVWKNSKSLVCGRDKWQRIRNTTSWCVVKCFETFEKYHRLFCTSMLSIYSIIWLNISLGYYNQNNGLPTIHRITGCPPKNCPLYWNQTFCFERSLWYLRE